MDEFNKRLKEERKRLGLKQDEICTVTGVSRNTQSRYELGDRFPDIKYLAAISDLGVDILYVITGRKDNFNSDELELLSLFRATSLENKSLAVQALKGQLPIGNVGIANVEKEINIKNFKV